MSTEKHVSIDRMARQYLTLKEQLQIQTQKCQTMQRTGKSLKSPELFSPRKIIGLPSQSTGSQSDDRHHLNSRASKSTILRINAISDGINKLTKNTSECYKLPVLSPILKDKQINDVFSQMYRQSENTSSSEIPNQKTSNEACLGKRKRLIGIARTARKTVVNHKKYRTLTSLKYGASQKFKVLLKTPVSVPKHYERIGEVCYPSQKFDVLVAKALEEMYNCGN